MEDTYLDGFEHEVGDNRVPRRYHFATEAFRSTAGICPKFSEHVWNGNSLVDATGSDLLVEWVASGMISSSDLLKFAIAIGGGKLLSPSSINILQEWKSAREEAEMGHGLFRFKSPLGNGNWLGHNGSVLDFTGAL
jgi:D-alanyl-D-alanine carboxypeptidase